MPDEAPAGGSREGDVEETVRRFHELYYTEPTIMVEWLGVRALKCPLDLWTYQEIISRNRPELIIETGTGRGGTTYFMACICEALDSGRVMSIDTREVQRPSHPRIRYLTGSSVDPDVFAAVEDAAGANGSVMVVLDANHSAEHVLAELRTYAPLIGEGHYMIAEDTNVNGHPVFPDHGPGPWEAVQAFLAEPAGQDFEVDRSCERFFLTMNPCGYLRRTSAASRAAAPPL